MTAGVFAPGFRILSLKICTASHRNLSGKTGSRYVFDYASKIRQRNHAAQQKNLDDFDYIREEVAYRLSDRVCDISRKFDVALDIGCGRGYLSQFLTTDSVGILYQCDSSAGILKRVLPSKDVPTVSLTLNEELLPFRSNTVDLVISSMSLHWINDLPGLLKQILRCLRNDGCFLGVMAAADTLFELRVSLQLAELDRLGGIAPHVNPFVDCPDMGDLLQRAGFNLITMDVDTLVIHYPNMFALLDDLRGMGESNAALNRPLHLGRDVLLAASAIYDEKFGELRQNGLSGERCIPATYRLLYFIGWKPDPSQKQPLPRGSAQFSLRDLNRIDELINNQNV